MAAEAFADELVTTVIAHTLPEHNASNRVLKKAGFHFDGQTQDAAVRRYSAARVRATQTGGLAAGGLRSRPRPRPAGADPSNLWGNARGGS